MDEAAALDHLPVAVLSVGPDRRLRLANRRAVQLLKLPAAPLDRPLADLVARDAASALDGMIEELRATGRAPDRTLPPLVFSAAILPGGGSVIAIRELPAASPTGVALTGIPSKVGHDLKTPLTSIKAYTEALSDMATNEQMKSFLKVVDEETDRLVAMINELVRLGRPPA